MSKTRDVLPIGSTTFLRLQQSSGDQSRHKEKVLQWLKDILSCMHWQCVSAFRTWSCAQWLVHGTELEEVTFPWQKQKIITIFFFVPQLICMYFSCRLERRHAPLSRLGAAQSQPEHGRMVGTESMVSCQTIKCHLNLFVLFVPLLKSLVLRNLILVLGKKDEEENERGRDRERLRAAKSKSLFLIFLRFSRTWTKRYLITSQTRVKRVSWIYHRLSG